MAFIIKLAFALVALAVVVPLVAGDTPVGQVLRAVWQDAATFCERRPEACAEGVALARDAGSFIAETIDDLRAAPDPGSLTAEDRNLAPSAAPAAAGAPQTALAGHGAKPLP